MLYCLGLIDVTQNTYQLILATNGNSSYAIFVYEDIAWSEFSFSIKDNVSGIVPGSGSSLATSGDGNSNDTFSIGSGNDTFSGGSDSTTRSGDMFGSGTGGMENSASMDGNSNITSSSTSGSHGTSMLSVVTRLVAGLA